MAIILQITSGDEVALSTDGSWTVRYDPTTNRLKFKAAGKDVMSLSASGNLRITGQVSTGLTTV